MVTAAEAVTWSDAGLVLLLFASGMALLFLYRSWSMNRADRWREHQASEAIRRRYHPGRAE